MALASCLPWSLPELDTDTVRLGTATRSEAPRQLEDPGTAGEDDIGIVQARDEARVPPAGTLAAPDRPPLRAALPTGSALWLSPRARPSVTDPDEIARRLAEAETITEFSSVAAEIGLERGRDLPGRSPPRRIMRRTPIITEEPSTGAPILVIPQGGRLGILAVPLDGSRP